MDEPKTTLRDFQSFYRDETQLMAWLIQGRIDQDKFDRMNDDLKKEYKDRLFQSDVYLFDSVDDLEQALLSRGLPLSDSIEHERMHGLVAEQLDYTVRYGFQILKDDQEGFIGYVPFTLVVETLNIEDAVRILSAPTDDLSTSDKMRLDVLTRYNKKPQDVERGELK